MESLHFLEQSREFESFDDFLKGGIHCFQARYTNTRTQYLSAIEAQLVICHRLSDDFKSIHPEIFKAVKQFYVNTARREMSQCMMYQRLPGRDRQGEFVNSVWRALASCILHMDAEDLKHLQTSVLTFTNGVKDAQKKKDLLNSKFKEGFYDFCELEALLQSDESCKFVSGLIRPFRGDQTGNVKGELKIVKVLRREDGNRLYKTVCIARKVAQEQADFTFEVLRDYGSFDIRSVNKDTKETEPLYRVRRKLQPQQCEFR